MANNIEQEIRARIEEFTEELAALVRQSAVESLREALGTPARRGPGRPRKTAAVEPARGPGRPRGPARRGPGRPRGSGGRGAKRGSAELEQLSTGLFNHIKENPGQRIEEIARAMGMSTKDLNLPAKKLIASKQVKTKGQKRATQYFPR
jgi:hypothetical protein